MFLFTQYMNNYNNFTIILSVLLTLSNKVYNFIYCNYNIFYKVKHIFTTKYFQLFS